MSDANRGAWHLGMRAAVLAVLFVCGLRGALNETGQADLIEFVLGALTGGAVLWVSHRLLRGLVGTLRNMPAEAVTLALAVLTTLLVFDQWSMAELWRLVRAPSAWRSGLAPLTGLSVSSLAVLVLAVALLTVVVARSRKDALALAFVPGGLRLFALAAAACVTAVGIVLSLVTDGRDPHPTTFRTIGPAVADAVAFVDASDPGSAGTYEVERVSYGAGRNARRPEFGKARDLESRAVDARALLPEWKGLRGSVRERYWGFDLSEAPLNGLVWAPVGEGPFPLVVIVHGNHSMVDVSDPGYAYLGELLASRGFIVVSVDENYINGSWSGDFRGKEMAVRGWLLLEHLALWRDWSTTEDHPFAGRVDLDRIALVGHSRGGEAVSIAHAFNALAHHPDDATIAFDYGFDISALVAIAQVDQRYHRRVELDDVSFFALQGSYDADEPAFHGLRQYNRIELSEGSPHFKAGLYVHGANHGQFNEGWGRKDFGPPGAWLLNLAPIIDADVQRRIAAVSIAAFLESTLHDDDRYRAFFRDPRVGKDWLPEGIYVHRYTDASFAPIADFEEDIDVTSASLADVRIFASGLALWREEALTHRDGRLQGSAAAVLGWRAGSAPEYTLEMPEGLKMEVDGRRRVLSFEIAPSPERAPDDESDEDEGARSAASDSPVVESDARDTALAFTVEVEDASGRTLRYDGRSLARVAPPMHVQYLKSQALNRARYTHTWEAVLQTVEIPLEADPRDLRAVRMRFDGASAGTVLVDQIGIRIVAE